MSAADQLEAGVHNALKAHDVKAAVDILEALAGVDLARAARVHDEIQEALTVAKALRRG